MANNEGALPNTVQELIQSVSVQILGSSKFRRFQRLYGNDRIAFVYDVLPHYAKTLAPYQEEILGTFDEGHERVSVRGPHGLGKTFIAAVLTHHTVLTAEDDAKIPTTASAWRQLEHYLWPEIKKLAKGLDWVTIGREPYTRDELLQLSIRLSQGTVEAFAVASDDHNTIEGAHATQMFYIFDEAKSIPRPTWNAAEGAFATMGLGGIKPMDDVAIVDIVEQPGLVLYTEEADRIAISNIDFSEPEIDVDYVDRDNGNNNSEYNNGLALGNNPSEYNKDGGSGKPLVIYSNTPGNKPSTSYPTTPPGRQPLDQPTPINAPPFQQSSNQSIDSLEWLDNIQSTIVSMEVMEARAFAISTPGEPSGQFYDIHMRKPGYEDWVVRHVSIEEAIKAGRVSPKWVKQRARQWGLDSAIFMNRVLGEFADITEEGVIPMSWIRMANNRWSNWRKGGGGVEQFVGKKTLGVDVARGGVDKTVMAVRHALCISSIHVFSKLPTTSTAGYAKTLGGGRYIHIETDGGLGASVYDMLHEDGIPLLRPITVNGATTFRDKSGELGFANVRSAMWWHMRELLDPNNGEEVLLPPIQELITDLASPRYTMRRQGIVQVEGKDEIALRIGRSTDYGDAVCLAFWKTSSGGGVVI